MKKFNVLLFWILFLVLWIAGTYATGLLPPGLAPRQFWTGAVGCVMALLCTRIVLRMEKQSFSDIGLVWEKWTLPRFFLGLVIGAALLLLILLVIAGFSHHRLVVVPLDMGKMGDYFILLLLSIAEEVGFRGYPLVTLQRTVGVWMAQLIVAVAFALYHVAYGWSPVVAFTGPFFWSFAFSISALRSKGIALPVGVHLAVNIFKGVFMLVGG